ncbi:Swarming motility protein YbiA [Thalassoglobus neptunius]|uniref:Swarming motility protein YbiA n=1 Tax=Thalassoglobus neptunius TaxID=1938619 RepID=A0A5C5X511_9PLAN|nr:NADAR family protein [Thalassoglobus neptunius]TWT58064.1 Swarming motility protein YbiA [Thalassoglobus neptunius]
MKTIMSFSGEYRWLSNFWAVSVVLDRETYPSVEHAYQASKTTDRFERQLIQESQSAGHAKKLGSKLKERKDWDSIKLHIMEDLLRQKFSVPDLKEQLIATGHAEIIEGNTWGDHFWGVCKGTGENHLGTLLMKIREELVA